MESAETRSWSDLEGNSIKVTVREGIIAALALFRGQEFMMMRSEKTDCLLPDPDEVEEPEERELRIQGRQWLLKQLEGIAA